MLHKNKSLYVLFAVLWLFVQLTSAQLPKSIVNQMSSRDERYHHYLWHNLRDNWNRYDSDTQAKIKARGWQPPRPSRDYDSDGNSIAITDNNSGEDFLYMHRQMIAQVKKLAQGNSTALAMLTGWKTLPAPGDKDWPVPKVYTVPGSSGTTNSVKARKTDDFYNKNIKPMQDLFTDYDELRDMTLGELGSRIELTVHNWLHIRFSSSESYGYRPGGSGPFPFFEAKWDDPKYDWLGDTYSSHVNPTFWKLHGWVDDRIEDWRKANRLSSIRWKATWMGGSVSDLSDLLDPNNPRSFSRPGVTITRGGDNSAIINAVPESGFTDDVQVDLGSAGTIGKASATGGARRLVQTKPARRLRARKPERGSRRLRRN